VELVVAVAQGRADPLHGRFIHASDDLSHLVETAACGFGPDSRKLRIQKYASADPLPT